VQAINFFTQVVSSKAYQSKGGLTFSASHGLKFDHQSADDVKQQLNNIMTPEFIAGLARTLITQFMLLRADDFEAWEDTPEEYLQEEQLVRADEKIRPAAEALLLELFRTFPGPMGSVCMELLGHTLKASPPSPQCPPAGSPAYKEMLVKEAVYLAVGVGAYELHDVFKANNFEFGHWFQQVLTTEINTTDPGLKVSRRRAIWVVGEWIANVPDGLRQAIYKDIHTLLAQGELVVGMTAAGALRRAVEDMGFSNDLASFMPFMGSIFEQLFKLMSLAQDLDTRNQVMHVIRQLTETVGDGILPAVPILFTYLPALWENCQNQNLLRNSILITFTFLANALAAESQKLHSFLVPVLQYCTTDTQEPERGHETGAHAHTFFATPFCSSPSPLDQRGAMLFPFFPIFRLLD
jgi:hypothetical protein